jgi:hypothetical protein
LSPGGGVLVATVLDRVGEAAVAAATVFAAVAVVYTLPALVNRPRGRSGLTPALVIITGGAAITFVAWLAFTVRCSQSGCHIHPGDSIGGLEPWWRRKHSWQWGGQLALASLGLVTAAIALALAARERPGARKALLAARAFYATWAVVAFLVPAAWEIFVIT